MENGCILLYARYNSQMILALKEKKDARKTNSFEIGFNLVMSLVRPELERRSTKGLQKNITQKINLYVNRDDDNDDDDDDGNAPQLFNKLGDKRKICTTCSDHISGPQYKQKRTALPRNKTQCQKCGVPCCPSHLTYICGKHTS